MFKIAICDEPYAADYTEKLLEESGYPLKGQPVAKFSDPFALFRYIESIKGQTDILFFTIAPRQQNSLQTAVQICREYPKIKIIIVTEYMEYAGVMMEACPVYFLIKPLKTDALSKAMDAAIGAILHEPSDIVDVRIKDLSVSISVREVFYMKSGKGIVTIYGLRGERTVCVKLKELAYRLPPAFCHCHRSFIVNLEKVRHMDKKAFYLAGGQYVPIGQTKYKKVKEQFAIWFDKK